MGADVTVYQSIDAAITSEFVGYDKLDVDSKISVLTTEDEIVEALTDGQRGTIIADPDHILRNHGRPAGR